MISFPADKSVQCLVEESNGSEYRGTVSETARGNRCLNWSRFQQREHVAASKGLGKHNYCRNPDNSPMPWCIVKRGARLVREFCTIPKCEPKRKTTCGEQSSNMLFKIVGGFRSSIESQPWIAAIFKRRGFTCGGTLIAPCWVLTAAHCFSSSQNEKDYTVYLGKNAINETDPSKEQMFKVAKLVIHQDYDFMNENYNNDIALLQIVNSDGQCAQRTSSVRTVCLPPAKQTLPFRADCKIAGYGSVTSCKSQILYSRYLKETYVKVVPETVCQREDYYGKSEIPLTGNMFCAASPSWKDDACQGDSGGPLVYEQNGRIFLFGIVSWGEKCAVKNKPGVYTKVTNYNGWIAEHTDLPSFTTGIMYPRKD
ncbi:hypothetical protein NFI96_020200 [Prochilodus magdalenae]|nr:hypothetical protein NFI96_020200 [Prochilodus magdalenae]